MRTATDFTLDLPARRRPEPPVGAPKYELRMRVMGTDAHLLTIQGEPALLEEARDRLHDLHARWTRFETTSEVSRLNAAAGTPMRVTPETLLLVGLAVTAWERTDGRFDPSVLPALEAAGYDRDFADIVGGESATTTARRVPATPTPGCIGVRIDEEAGTVTLPRGTALDFGAIAKGLAADMVVTDLLEGGAIGACVNIGGDLRAAGVAPHRDGWLVGLDHPGREHGSRNLGVLRLRGGAVATSSRMKRRWDHTSGARRHHLIDPRTGLPADCGIQSVSVVADEAWQAEVLATAAFLTGPSGAPDLLTTAGAHGLVVLDDGTVRTTPGWGALAA